MTISTQLGSATTPARPVAQACRLRTIIVASLAAVAVGLSATGGYSETGPADDAARVAAARAASKELGEKLKAQLVAAIASGGAVAAIPVCKTIAPQIGGDISKAHGFEIRRTSLKVRNPTNAPDAFEQRVLADFAQKLAAGADPMTIEHSEVVSDAGKKTFRYMKAIPTAAEPCLACHGGALKDDVKAEIAKLYPSDMATGFKAGELRGAFSVRQAIK